MPNFPSLQGGALLFDVLPRLNGSKDLVMGLVAKAMTGPSELSQVERELIATYVSALNRCNYCVTSHAALAARLGAEQATIKAVSEGASSSLPDRLQPLFALAAKVTKDAENVTEADIAAIVAQGWGEQAAFDCLFVSSLFCFVNRIASASGISVRTDQAEDIAGMIVKHGYDDGR